MQLFVAILLASEFFLIVGLLIKTLQTRWSLDSKQPSQTDPTLVETKVKTRAETVVPFHISHIEGASDIVKNLSNRLSKISCMAERVEVMLATFEPNQIMDMIAKNNSDTQNSVRVQLQSGPLTIQKWTTRTTLFIPRHILSNQLANISIKCIKRQDLDELIDDDEIKCRVVVCKVKQSCGLPDPRFRFGLKAKRMNIFLSETVDESVVCLYEPYVFGVVS
jgi:hypothetical protein